MFSVLLICVILLGANALFVLVEFAIVRVRTSRIEMLVRTEKPGALHVQEVLSRLDVYLAAIQLGLTITALTLGAIGEPALTHWFKGHFERFPILPPPRILHGISFALALLILAFSHTVFGELVPRLVGIQKAEIVSLWSAYPLRLFSLAFRIPIAFMSFCSVAILRLFGMKSIADSESAVTEEEMRILLGETHEKGTFPLERLLLLENLFDFGSAKASEAMIPLEKAAMLSLNVPWTENLETIRARRYSRYPLRDETLGIVGMLHVKDFLFKSEDGRVPDLRALRREIALVSESDSLEKLLKYFPDKGIHMALVHNAAGAAVGLLTLEDIIEELIGEVHDEFDLPQAWSLMDVVVAPALAVGLAAADRQSAIAQLLAKLKAAFPELNEPEILKAILDREMKFSSAVGHGVAVPHARLPNISRPMVAVGRFSKPVPFPSPDSAPVKLVFLILTPASSPIIQLKVLARIASLATNENLRRKLLRAKTAESMLEILRTADTLLAA